MTPTVFVALLSHPARAGLAVGDPDLPPRMGAPIHLSLHTSDRAAVDALNAAMREEWDRQYAHNLGHSSEWERARLSRRLVEDGYLAAAIERPVALSEDEATCPGGC